MIQAQAQAQQTPTANLVIDLETVGKKAGCAILSIGVAPAEPVSSTFYITIDVYSCYEAGLHWDRETLDWWNQQKEEPRKEAFSGNTPLANALTELSKYITEIRCQLGFNIRVWGNSNTFDIGILEAAYEAIDMEPPWTYREVMDYRTLRVVCPSELATTEPVIPHHALKDAKAEAANLRRMLAWLSANTASVENSFQQSIINRLESYSNIAVELVKLPEEPS